MALATSEASARVGRGFCGHGIEHLRGGDHGDERVAGARNDLLLHHGNLLRIHLHAEVAARDHHAIGNAQNFIEIFDGFGLLELGDHRRGFSGAGDGGFGGFDVAAERTKLSAM